MAQAKLRHRLESTRAGAVIVSPALAESVPPQYGRIVVDSPYLYFARMTQWWASRMRPQEIAGIHPSAVIEAGAHVDPTAHIGPHAYIGAGARVGRTCDFYRTSTLALGP